MAYGLVFAIGAGVWARRGDGVGGGRCAVAAIPLCVLGWFTGSIVVRAYDEMLGGCGEFMRLHSTLFFPQPSVNTFTVVVLVGTARHLHG